MKVLGVVKKAAGILAVAGTGSAACQNSDRSHSADHNLGCCTARSFAAHTEGMRRHVAAVDCSVGCCIAAIGRTDHIADTAVEAGKVGHWGGKRRSNGLYHYERRCLDSVVSDGIDFHPERRDHLPMNRDPT